MATSKRKKKKKPTTGVSHPKGPRQKVKPGTDVNNLRELRKRGIVLSQYQVGKLIDLDITTVNAHENGRRALTKDVAQRYANLFTDGNMVLLFNLPEGLLDEPKCECCGQTLPPGMNKDVPKPDDLEPEE